MLLLLYLLERFYSVICRHKWIRDRREDGTLGLRCMKCMRRKEYSLVQIIQWKPDYKQLPSSRERDFPPGLRKPQIETAADAHAQT